MGNLATEEMRDCPRCGAPTFARDLCGPCQDDQRIEDEQTSAQENLVNCSWTQEEDGNIRS